MENTAENPNANPQVPPAAPAAPAAQPQPTTQVVLPAVESKPFYKDVWFWTTVGCAVAAGVGFAMYCKASSQAGVPALPRPSDVL